MQKLGHDLHIDRRSLYECLKFARLYPIVGRHPQLVWSHYRRFIQVADPVQRKALMAQTLKEGWTGEEVAARVVELNATTKAATKTLAPVDGEPQELLKPNRGTPGLYRIVAKSFGPALSGVEGLSVDLGFRHYWPLTADQRKRFAPGEIVRIGSDDSLRSVPEATKADLFTYAAQLVRVVDGDTLLVALKISPGEFLEQKLRLRGLDAPEMSTPEGKAAKRFVDALLAKTTAIIINTTKPDKYERYLADVFLVGPWTDVAGLVEPGPGSATPATVPREMTLFLNNALLEQGHAVRKDAADFGDDWGFK